MAETQIAEVGAVGRLGLRCAHAQEVDLGSCGVRKVRGEGEAARGPAVTEELVQARFEERGQPAGQVVHPAGVDVDPHHGVAHGRERGRMHGAEVAAADHGNLHSGTPSGAGSPSGFAAVA